MEHCNYLQMRKNIEGMMARSKGPSKATFSSAGAGFPYKTKVAQLFYHSWRQKCSKLQILLVAALSAQNNTTFGMALCLSMLLLSHCPIKRDKGLWCSLCQQQRQKEGWTDLLFTQQFPSLQLLLIIKHELLTFLASFPGDISVEKRKLSTWRDFKQPYG